MTEPLDILFEDAHVLAVVKPAGITTQGPPAGAPSLEWAVRRHLAPEAPGAVYLGTVHRLDRPVSGVVVWAKTPKAARRLAAQFAAREARKEYWAVVEAGSKPDGEEVWDDWLAPPDASGIVRVVEPDSAGARRAITRVRRSAGATTPDAAAWLCLRPETGRTHQLRVQAACRGMPIVGDAAYGSVRGFPKGIALHARTLAFRHPALRDVLELTAPLPATWFEGGMGPPSRTPLD